MEHPRTATRRRRLSEAPGFGAGVDPGEAGEAWGVAAPELLSIPVVVVPHDPDEACMARSGQEPCFDWRNLSCRRSCIESFTRYVAHVMQNRSGRLLTLACRMDDRRKTRILRVDGLGSGWFRVALSNTSFLRDQLERISAKYDLAHRNDPRLVGGGQGDPHFTLDFKQRSDLPQTDVPLGDAVDRFSAIGSLTAHGDFSAIVQGFDTVSSFVADLAPIFLKRCKQFTQRDGRVVHLSP